MECWSGEAGTDDIDALCMGYLLKLRRELKVIPKGREL
jgi:hypothetical protein